MMDVWDLVSALLLFAGAFFCFTAAVGVVRFPDTMTRLHAAAKPQVFGLILILLAIAVDQHSWRVIAICLLVAAFQITTTPVAAHMIARTAYRTGTWDAEGAVVDDLAEDLDLAGFHFEPISKT